MVSHLDNKNNPIMVNVGNKNTTKRIAEAQGEVVFDKLTFKKIEKLKSKKGSIKNIAIVAGIMGAKETSRLIPFSTCVSPYEKCISLSFNINYIPFFR